jgi:uncharacterized membrane protein
MKRVIWLIVIFTLFFGFFRVMQHYTFTNNALDDGFNDNLIWNTLHGRFMYCDLKGYTALGDHLELATLLFVPAYALGLGPWILFFFPPLLIGLGALPVYWLAREKLGDHPLTLLWPLAYLLYLPTVNITFQGYYPIALCITPLLFACYYLLKDNYAAFSGWLLAAMLCQENIYLVAAGFGLYILLFKKPKLFGAALLGGGLALFYLAVAVIIPHFNAAGQYAYYDRYAYLGGSLPEIITTLVTRPFYAAQHVLTGDKLLYLCGLLLPVAFLPVWSAAELIPALPVLGLNLLSLYRDMYQLGTRYASALVPFVFVAAILGLGRLGARANLRWVRRAMLFGLSLSVLYFGLGFFIRYTWITPAVREGHELLKLVPAGAAVCAVGNIYPHLSHRQRIWLFPQHWERADYLFLCQLDPTWPVDGDYAPALDRLRNQKAYGKILEYIFIGEAPTPGPLLKKDYAPLLKKVQQDKRFAVLRAGRHYLLLHKVKT